MDNLNEMEKHLAEIEERAERVRQENKELDKLLAMPFHKRIQHPSQTKKLKEFEATQKGVFMKLIKKREELKHLKGEQENLFAEFFIDWLKGNVISINDFFYENCKDMSVKEFFNKNRKFFRTNLKKIFIDR